MKPVVYPVDWLFRNVPPTIDQAHRRILAEGDSWFSIGTLNLPAASNVPFKLEMKKTTIIVNCAYPGDTLAHMVDWAGDPYFDRLLCKPNFQMPWEGILISAGGNDLIDAARVEAVDAQSNPVPANRRLFLTADEIAANAGGTNPDRFISPAGWQAFATYLQANFDALVKRRDSGVNRHVPICLHTYVAPIVRPAGTLFNSQGWLYPSLKSYGIDGQDAQDVSDLIFGKLRKLLLDLDCSQPGGLPHVHVFDSAGITSIIPAVPGHTGSSNDWVNEIHLTPAGYAKVGAAMGPWLETIVP
jgi:lysophospholipase L1-like esterase